MDDHGKDNRRRARWVALVSLLVAWQLSWAGALPSPAPGTTPGAASSVEAFLDWFWERPLAQQKTARIFPQEIIHPLAPDTCGLCHGVQHADWLGSRHALAMGPGAKPGGLTMDWLTACTGVGINSSTVSSATLLPRRWPSQVLSEI